MHARERMCVRMCVRARARACLEELVLHAARVLEFVHDDGAQLLTQLLSDLFQRPFHA